MNTHLGVVPIRSFASAKARLADVLTDAERQILVQTMAEKVVGTLLDLMPTTVASPDAEVLAWAANLGAMTIPDPAFCTSGNPRYARPPRSLTPPTCNPDEALNAALTESARYATSWGARTLVILAADLPSLSHDDVHALTRLPGRPGATLAADKHGTGTNGLAVCPPSALRFAFGPRSLALHKLIASRTGLRVRVIHRAGLELDYDTPEDLRLGFLANTPSGL